MECSGGERTGRCSELAAWPGLAMLAGPMAGSCRLWQMWGAAGWGWRSLIAKGQLKKEQKKTHTPPNPLVLNARPFSGWAGAVLTSTGAQSSLPEGPLLCAFAAHRSLGQALSSSGSGLVRGVWIRSWAGSLHHRSSFAQWDQRHCLGCCTFCRVQGVLEHFACG